MPSSKQPVWSVHQGVHSTTSLLRRKVKTKQKSLKRWCLCESRDEDARAGHRRTVSLVGEGPSSQLLRAQLTDRSAILALLLWMRTCTPFKLLDQGVQGDPRYILMWPHHGPALQVKRAEGPQEAESLQLGKTTWSQCDHR